MAQITAKVYDATGATLIATLSQRRNPNWLHQLNDTGSGSVQIHELDADLAAHPTITNYYNIVRFQIGGTDRFAIVVENPDIPPVPADEYAGRWWTLSGPGVLALLNDAIVYPEAPLTQTAVTVRAFGWMAASFNDSSWTSAVQIQRQDATSPVAGWHGYPKGWREHTAYWIWSRALSSGSMPVGTSYFRKSFTLASSTYLTFIASCDNQFRLWLDDELIMDYVDPIPDWRDMKAYSRILASGTHQLAAECINASGGGANPAGFICAVYTLNTDGSINTVALHTDNTWKADDYPATPPGMTVGQILRILVSEAQTRGALTGITLGFTDSLDTNGNAWTVIPNIGFQVGAKLLDVVRTLVEQVIDVEMTPTLVLNAYNKGTLGSDKTATVSLLRGTHFEELNASSSGHRTNAMLLRTQLGTLVERTDSTSLGARKRIEEYDELGTAPSTDAAQNAADAVFPDFAYPVLQLTGKVTEASGPDTTYKPGDKIKMPNKANVATATDVISLAFEEDDAGNLISHIEASLTDS
jgi:hypothetical protein